ncbi:unnamed protein product [Arabidopsis lyrata]|nr:unnamed protein product [Arabidopsis lyrata]
MKEGKSSKSNQQEQHEQIYHQNSHLGSFKFAKLFDSEASWDKDQLGDVLHWIRQVVGLLCGLVWGAIPLVGGIWLLLSAPGRSICFSKLIPACVDSGV